MILGKNFHCFDFFFLSKISLKKCFIIFWIQSNPLQVVKISILDSHQTGFFLRGQSIILDKNFKFFIVPFWAKQAQKQCLVMFRIGKKPFCSIKISILEQAILCHKNIDFRQSPNMKFPKGLAHDFGQQFSFFSFFLFEQNKPRKNVSCYFG